MASSHIALAAAIAEREHLLIRSAAGYSQTVTALPNKLDALRAVARVLTGANVPHALIGGLAVGIRSGVPRATLDIDIAISTAADKSFVTELLVSTGFHLVGRFDHSINFKHLSGEPVQLAFDPAFDPMIARAEQVLLDDVSIPVVTATDLIATKRRAAAAPTRRRSQALSDEADIALLEGDVPDPDEGW